MSEALEITKADFDADKENYLDRVENGEITVSYTHLTLPTICSV